MYCFAVTPFPPLELDNRRFDPLPDCPTIHVSGGEILVGALSSFQRRLISEAVDYDLARAQISRSSIMDYPEISIFDLYPQDATIFAAICIDPAANEIPRIIE